MTPTGHLPVLVVRHVTWEGPHRILRAFDDRPVHLVDTLPAGAALPPVDTVAGAVFMGGPMSANDTDRLPQLAAEITWLRQAVAADVPVLGICLGAQLIARALGARVYPAATKELGWAPIDILDDTDPLLGALAPRRTVLHWHGEILDPPPGSAVLARSAQTACQAFRVGNAWGMLFHPEADRELLDEWLAEPSMAAEAEQVHGPTAAHRLRADADAAEPELLATTDAMFAAFATRIAAHADRYVAGTTA
ncbi:hypothetical protein GCM10010156_65320 [Planobispora rosea]|uniref:Glutamine amidotransferase domain-containing protein n=1 Tax=Planobispora rosea TaxID=35762 RepID=A0A8J3S6W5_PLARO|nr:type 1 glutamine amidotransferase [Planobispora rosea]GGS98056.1 hypothetical protein GCM10010156_65320 [Planobispora rosea]GIH87929.1 hypothetical protein Pro02_63370 [Planobispora rosea]